MRHHVVFGHANGFPAGTYAPFRSALEREGLVASWRAVERLGHAHPPGVGWTGVAAELAELAETAPRPRLGIGHSLGAYGLYLASERHPALFDAVVLLEPPMFHPAKSLAWGLLRRAGLATRVPPASLALRRRRRFPDPASARAHFAGKPLFGRVDPACLDAYVAHGLRPEGRQWTLAFDPAVEAEVFRTGPALLPRARHAPARAWWVTGADSAVVDAADRRWTARRLRGYTALRWPGGHLFPLEDPAGTAERVIDLLRAATPPPSC